MDDNSWDFFCNNSPRLVIKQRPKTPNDRFANNSQLDIPKIMLNRLQKPNMIQKPSELSKSAFRTIYRDHSPMLGIPKSTIKLQLKPNADLKGIIKPITLKKSISPIRSLKKSITPSKRVLITAKEKQSYRKL